MNLHELECFLKICELQSLSAAAKELFLTPQAMSKGIMRMEQELGAPILLRSKKGVRPTAYGKILYTHACRIIQEYHDASQEISALVMQDAGFLRMVSAFGILRFLSPEYIHAFTDKQPHIHFDYMEYPDIYIEENVLQGHYDIGLVPYVQKNSALTYIPLFSREIFFITHPKSRFYDRQEVSVRDISAEPIIIENQNFLIHHIMEETCRNEQTDLDVYFNTSGFSLCYKLCKEQKGNTASMDFIFHDMGSDNLRMIPFHEHPQWNVALIYKKDMPLSKPVQDFIAYSRNWCRKNIS